MFGFMFGVLGSVVFWAIYLVVSFFIATFIMKTNFNLYFRTVIGLPTHGYDMFGCSPDKFCGFCIFIYLYVFWPLQIVFYIIAFLFKAIVFNSMVCGMKKAANMMPTIKKENGKIIIISMEDK